MNRLRLERKQASVVTPPPGFSSSINHHEAAEEPPSKKQRTCQSPQQSQGGTHASAEPSMQQPGVSGTTSGTGAVTPSTTTATAGNEGSYGESMLASRPGPGRSAVSPGSTTIRRQQHHPNETAAAETAEMQAHE